MKRRLYSNTLKKIKLIYQIFIKRISKVIYNFTIDMNQMNIFFKLYDY